MRGTKHREEQIIAILKGLRRPWQRLKDAANCIAEGKVRRNGSGAAKRLKAGVSPII